MIRYYFALTNNCNHSCEYCSCYSRPGKKSYLDFDVFKKYINSSNNFFEVQLEGGEPLLHPNFYEFIDYSINTKRCNKIIITTNSKIIPFKEENQWLNFIRESKIKFILKPSINNHLFKTQENLFEKLSNLLFYSKKISNLEVLFNVRLDHSENDDVLIKNIEKFGLKDHCNIFHFQRYGYAKNIDKFELPFIIDNPVEFYLISPDGKNFEKDLIQRSEHMSKLD